MANRRPDVDNVYLQQHAQTARTYAPAGTGRAKLPAGSVIQSRSTSRAPSWAQHTALHPAPPRARWYSAPLPLGVALWRDGHAAQEPSFPGRGARPRREGTASAQTVDPDERFPPPRSSRIFSLAGLSTPSAPKPAAEQGEDASWQETVALAQERAKATAKSQCALLQMVGVAATAGIRPGHTRAREHAPSPYIAVSPPPSPLPPFPLRPPFSSPSLSPADPTFPSSPPAVECGSV